MTAEVAPKCERCPLLADCNWYRGNVIEVYEARLQELSRNLAALTARADRLRAAQLSGQDINTFMGNSTTDQLRHIELQIETLKDQIVGAMQQHLLTLSETDRYQRVVERLQRTDLIGPVTVTVEGVTERLCPQEPAAVTNFKRGNHGLPPPSVHEKPIPSEDGQ